MIQLMFANAPEMRAEIPVASLEECIDGMRQAVTIRSHNGHDVVGVGVGCYMPIAEKRS